MQIRYLIGPLISVLLVPGCATITKGTDDTIRFTSSPSGAIVTTNEIGDRVQPRSCLTPCKLKLNRKWTYDVSFEMEGYSPQTLRIEPAFSGDGALGMAGNVLTGGIIGAAIDGSTGAMNDLKPNPLHAVLRRDRIASNDAVSAEKGRLRSELQRNEQNGWPGN